MFNLHMREKTTLIAKIVSSCKDFQDGQKILTKNQLTQTAELLTKMHSFIIIVVLDQISIIL